MTNVYDLRRPVSRRIMLSLQPREASAQKQSLPALLQCSLAFVALFSTVKSADTNADERALRTTRRSGGEHGSAGSALRPKPLRCRRRGSPGQASRGRVSHFVFVGPGPASAASASDFGIVKAFSGLPLMRKAGQIGIRMFAPCVHRRGSL